MPFRSANLNYIFNKEYSEGVLDIDYGTDEDNIIAVKRLNKEFFGKGISGEALPIDILEGTRFQFISLRVGYPGLLIGLGNAHETGKKGEIKLGFTFDYVTGQPYVPGSSIKGAIKSAFAHEDYILELLQKLPTSPVVDVKALTDEIFEGVSNGKLLPLGKRDTFYDSYINYSKSHKSQNFVYPISEESITPHDDNPFKSPNTLTLVKIKPGIVMRFVFSLKDGLLTAGQKLSIFKTILKENGVGAKTNVGFGVLND